jgi:hypothetical protein
MRHHHSNKRRGAGELDQGPFAGRFNLPFPFYRTPYKRYLNMKSKLLQPISQSHEGVNRKRENTEGSSMPYRGHGIPPNPVNPAVDAEAGKDFPALLKHNYRPARS